MNWLDFISSITQHLAWPIAIIFVILILRKRFGELLLRLLAIKYKDFSVQFAQISKDVIEGDISEEEKKEWQRHQIVHETEFYRLYSNGILVQKYKIKVFPDRKVQEITYPLTFPNEALNITAVGKTEVHVLRLGQGNCTLSFPTLTNETEIELVITGL